MKWVEVSVHTTSEASDAVASKLLSYQELCGDYPAGGVSIEDSQALAAKAKRLVWDEVVELPQGLADTGVVVRAYFPPAVVTPRWLEELQAWLDQLPEFGLDAEGTKLKLKAVQTEDWAHAWKAHFHRQAIGNRLVILPSWEEYTPGPQECVITLDPGMAFGTGTHPTTVLCLEALEQWITPGDVVFDVGTGSGILAIAAAKLGARQVTAVDIDPVAAEAAQANVTGNDVADIVTVRQGVVTDIAGQGDLVLANIIAKVIIGIAPELYHRVKPGGMLLASGIIADKEAAVVAALVDVGFTIIQRTTKEEWVCLAVRRP
ncbi:MAG: 50S ribosomal protein L11 methyltransferase [Firmicutes bacterium]|nr:50S ribosomal protein L11 methyltransferase [Bacillota bacterium]